MNALIKELGGTHYNSIVYFQHYAQACALIDWMNKYNIQHQEIAVDMFGLFYIHYLTSLV